MKISEVRQFESHVRSFAAKWSAAPVDSPEREVQRRNCLLSLLILADYEVGADPLPEAEAAFSGLVRLRRDPTWRARGHLLFASVRPETEETIRAGALPLLESLEAGETPISYDLTIPVP